MLKSDIEANRGLYHIGFSLVNPHPRIDFQSLTVACIRISQHRKCLIQKVLSLLPRSHTVNTQSVEQEDMFVLQKENMNKNSLYISWVPHPKRHKGIKGIPAHAPPPPSGTNSDISTGSARAEKVKFWNFVRGCRGPVKHRFLYGAVRGATPYTQN